MSPLDKEKLYRHLEKYFIPNLDISTIDMGFTSSYDDVIRRIQRDAKNIIKTSDLIEKYQKRLNLKDKDVQEMIKISDLGNFKKNKVFPKDTMILLAICFQLNPIEANELMLASDIKINRELYLKDCVFDFYINNYQKYSNPNNNKKEFEDYLSEASGYIYQKKLMMLKY